MLPCPGLGMILTWLIWVMWQWNRCESYDKIGINLTLRCIVTNPCHFDNNNDNTLQGRINENSLQNKIVTKLKYLHVDLFLLTGNGDAELLLLAGKWGPFWCLTAQYAIIRLRVMVYCKRVIIVNSMTADRIT